MSDRLLTADEIAGSRAPAYSRPVPLALETLAADLVRSLVAETRDRVEAAIADALEAELVARRARRGKRARSRPR